MRWMLNATLGSSNLAIAGGFHTLDSDRYFGLIEITPNNYESVITSSTSGLGAFGGNISAVAVEDRLVDFDGDGRFNSGDISVAQGYVGNSWPTGLFPSPSILDRDGDGIADQDEVDAFEDMLNSGLDAGIFGDLNSNGVVDCTDFGLVPSGAFSAELGDAVYRIQLDQNLDGEVTPSEQLEFCKRVEHPDFKLDGFVDFFDFDDYSAAYQEGTDLSADWNYDGFIDFFDYDEFTASFQAGGC